MPSIKVVNLVKRFGSVTAVNRVSFQIESSEVVTILGPSGCGKSTILRLIAGLEKPDEGEIEIADELMTSVSKGVYDPPEKRHVGMVFQSYAIWPHMTLFNNIAFPLKRKGMSKEEIKERVTRIINLVKLQGLEDRYPSQVSGGQQQRAALARALAYEPKTLLLDEPLSNLDARLRDQMRLELRNMLRPLEISALFVTHDQLEAITLSDRVLVMNNGEIIEEGPPRQLYSTPKTKFVAEFMGSLNFIPGKIAMKDSSSGRVTVETSEGGLLASFAEELEIGEQVMLSVRPENIKITSSRPDEKVNVLEGRIKDIVFQGKTLGCEIALKEYVLKAEIHSAATLKQGDKVCVDLSPEFCIALKPR